MIVGRNPEEGMNIESRVVWTSQEGLELNERNQEVIVMILTRIRFLINVPT